MYDSKVNNESDDDDEASRTNQGKDICASVCSEPMLTCTCLNTL